jgi:hypothetical protein
MTEEHPEDAAVEPTPEADPPVVKKVKKAPAKRAPRKAPAKKVAPLLDPSPALSWEQDPAPEVVEPVAETPEEPVSAPVLVNTSAAVTEVASATGTLSMDNVRNVDNWRAFIHQITPVIVGVFVTLGVTTEDMALLWVPLVFAILDPLMSYANASDKGRRVAYGVLGTLQSGGLLVALLGDKSPWLPIISALLVAVSSQLARFYTPTSTIIPKYAANPDDAVRR